VNIIPRSADQQLRRYYNPNTHVPNSREYGIPDPSWVSSYQVSQIHTLGPLPYYSYKYEEAPSAVFIHTKEDIEERRRLEQAAKDSALYQAELNLKPNATKSARQRAYRRVRKAHERKEGETEGRREHGVRI
jgi:hypothetical protein